jgi:hypothetical protein
MNESYDYFRLPNNKGIEKVMPQLDGSFSEWCLWECGGFLI